MLVERIGRLHFWLRFIGFNLTFMMQHVLGMYGMPRRVFTDPPLLGWETMNMISTVGAFILAFAVLVFLVNVMVSLRSGEVAGDNPWNAWTLEWATTSPPPHENFPKGAPPVRGRRPFWDLQHPDLPDALRLASRSARIFLAPRSFLQPGFTAFMSWVGCARSGRCSV